MTGMCLIKTLRYAIMNNIYFVSLVVHNEWYTLFDCQQAVHAYCVAKNEQQAKDMVIAGREVIGDIQCAEKGKAVMPIGILKYDEYFDDVRDEY